MIYAVDAIMGAGKSSFGIQKLINNIKKDKKTIYITPYKNEIKRIMEECNKAGVKVYQPLAFNDKGKRDNFASLVASGKSIVATHACFDGISKDLFMFFKQHKYTLIMDEVHNVVQPICLTEEDREMLLEKKYISINQETDEVIWNKNNMSYEGRFSDIKNLCELGNIYYLSEKLCYWVFPCEIFKSMKDVYILTYLFEGQIQAAYYKSCGVKYKLVSLMNTSNKRGMEGKYKLVEYKSELQHDTIKEYANLISIYHGKLNDEFSMFSFSSTYFEKIKYNKEILKQIKNNIYNYFRNIVKTKAQDNMWTTLKSLEDSLKGGAYSKGFVEMTARATNEYSDKISMAYIYNRFINPTLITFFNKRGVEVNQDLYAISELLQWMFRSRIRKQMPINIYIPSLRMRGLLEKWCNCEIKMEECK